MDIKTLTNEELLKKYEGDILDYIIVKSGTSELKDIGAGACMLMIEEDKAEILNRMTLLTDQEERGRK